MNKLKLSLLLFCSLIAVANVNAAGWTGYGKIAELNQQPEGNVDVYIVANLPNNPTTCTKKDGFLLDISTERDKRVFTILLSAFMAGKEVKLFVTDGCPIWDTPKITGVYIK